jgi:uroporphyrinogen-III decarboxylase
MTPPAELKTRIEDLVADFQNQVAGQAMSPLERAFKTWSFQEPDRLLGSFAVFSPLSLGIREISTRTYYTDPWSFYYIQALSVVKFGNETPLMYGDPYNIEIEAMGGQVLFPQDSIPHLGEPLLKQAGELSRLAIPNPERDGRMPLMLELSRMHKQYLGSLVFAPVSCSGPFSLAVGLRGYKQILKDLRHDPLFVHELLRFCCRVVIAYGGALRDVHNASPTLQEAWSCLPNVSPKIFHEFCLPYIARCVEALRNPNTGFTGTVFHGYGISLAPEWQSFLRTVCASGLSAIPLMEEDVSGLRGYGQVDVREYKHICAAQKVVVMSFLHTDTISAGPPERIRSLVFDMFRKAGAGGGYTASTTWPVGAPLEHMQAFIDAFRACRYPIPKEA